MRRGADPAAVETSGESSVIDPLLAIEREDLTGVLELTAQGITTNIYARSGEIVFADAGTLGETLGRMLIRAGRLTEEQVAAVIRRMTDALVDNEHLRFGEIVVEYGFLDPGDLELALTQQVKEKLMGCVHRGPGKWRFLKDDPRLDDVGTYVVRTRPMLVEAASDLPERRLEEILDLAENRYPEIVAPDSIVAAEFELSKTEASVLRDLDGTTSLHFILSKRAAPEVMPLIAALVLGGGVELRTAPTRARQPSDSRPIPPEFRTARRARFVLAEDKTAPMPMPPVANAVPGAKATVASAAAADVPRSSSASARLSAVSFSTVAVPPPERRSSRQNLAPPTIETENRAREALDRLKTDLDRKKPVSKRKRWPDPKDERERRLMAESAFHQGRLFLRAEDPVRALPGLHRAFELCPDQREYELYVKWAQMLVNDTFKDDAQRREIQQLATRAVKENRDCELGFAILGHCAMHDGKDDAALRLFQRAATLDPKLVDAARYARLLAMRAANKAQRPAGKVDPPRRTKARGLLDTPLDEIVPVLLQKASDVLTSAMSGASAKNGSNAQSPERASTPEARVGVAHSGRTSSPDGTLEGLPLPAGAALEVLPSTPPPPKGSLPPPSMLPRPPPELSPPPAPSRPPLSPWRLPAQEKTAGSPPLAVAATPPLTPQAVSPAVPAVPAPPAVPGPPAPPTPVMAARVASVSRDDLPTGRPRRGRAAVIAGWMASLGVTAAAFYMLGSRSSTTTEPAVTTTDGARTFAPASAIATAAPPTSAPPATSAAPVESMPSASAAPAESAPPAASAATSTSTKAKTGILRTPKAYGRRVFVDGHIIGEGGREHTITCGPHRIRVGSAGVERSVTVPCGGMIELD